MSLIVSILIVGVAVVWAINGVEDRLKTATEVLEGLTRLNAINDRLAGLESDVIQIRRAVDPSHAPDWQPPSTETTPTREGNGLYGWAMDMEIDGRVLDQFESEQSISLRRLK